MFDLWGVRCGLLALTMMLRMEVNVVRADAPKAAQEDVKVYSTNRRFYAVSHLKEQKTAVFRARAATKPEWEMDGYFQVLFLSDDGQHLVEGYPGGNLLDLDVKPGDSFLVFFVAGKRVATLTVGDVFPDIGALAETTSGRAWGDFWGFEGPTRFTLQLPNERKITFDASTGKRVRR